MARDLKVVTSLPHYPILVQYGKESPGNDAWHMHEGLELHCCEGGRGFFEIGGRKWVVFPRCVTLIQASLPHRVCFEHGGVDGYRRSVITFLPHLVWGVDAAYTALIRSVLPSDRAPIRQVRMGETQWRTFRGLLKQVHGATDHRTKPGLDRSVRHLAALLYFLAGEISAADALTRRDSSHGDSMGRIDDLMERLTEGATPSISDVARDAHLSAGHFRRVFQRTCGISAGAYIRRRRIILAQTLLASGLSVTRTALDCGYDDRASFSRAFKDEIGVAPSEYRRRMAFDACN